MLIMKKIIPVLLLIIQSFVSFSQPADSEEGKAISPYFLVKSDDPGNDRLPLKKTSAGVNVVGVIADVTITQVYENEGKNALEAIYTFPASENAAVYAMEMTVGERKIVARIEEKKKARKDYEEAKKEGKRASLLEQQRPNVFQMNVANIMPGDRITVTLRYTELLVPSDGVYRFVYPTVVGPRYTGESKEGSQPADFAHTPYQHEGEDPLYDFDLDVTLSMGMPIQDITCNTHKVNVRYPSVDKALVNLDPSESSGGNRDFVLEYSLAGNTINTGIMLYEGEEENFFLAMIQPPERVEPKDIPPREYIFINDVSGSMRGYPMDISKKIMRNLVGNLRPEDRFNVLVFAGTSGWMADESLPANQENIEKGIAFIDEQSGGGGTNILSALKKSLSFPRAYEEMSRSFIIVTDGYVSVEKEVFDLIRENNDKANVFVFGIGTSVNRHLLKGMAHVGRGEPFIVLNKEESSQKAEKFRTYISSPVLTQIEKQFPGFEAYDTEPLTLPDVFAERPILIYGKYKGEAGGTIRLKGYAGRKRWKTNIDVSGAKPDEDNEALRYLWARKRIQMLDDYSHVGKAEEEKITALGLEYNLLTNYTSFVAIEEKPVNIDGKMKTVKQPLPMPQHVSDAAVGFGLEIEEETAMEQISFYDRIEIMAGLSRERQVQVKNYIEDVLMPQLRSCFIQHFGDFERITVTVGTNGRVANIRFDGIHISKQLKTCMHRTIMQWKFHEFNLAEELTFDITF